MLSSAYDNSEYRAFAKLVIARSAGHKVVVSQFTARSGDARARADRLIELSNDALTRIERLRDTHDAACRRER